MVSGKNQRIRVLIADSHPLVRVGLQSCFSRKGNVLAVGEAADGEEALQKALTLAPDVVLLGISMPRRNGLAVIEALRQQAPLIKILVLSMYSHRGLIFRTIQAGAHGYISKVASIEQIFAAIEAVFAGKTFFSTEIAQAALVHLVSSAGKGSSDLLSKGERDVLVLITQGKTSREIAKNLGVEVRTVETHRERLMERLDIHSVAGLTRFAVASGLSSLEYGQEQMMA